MIFQRVNFLNLTNRSNRLSFLVLGGILCVSGIPGIESLSNPVAFASAKGRHGKGSILRNLFKVGQSEEKSGWHQSAPPQSSKPMVKQAYLPPTPSSYEAKPSSSGYSSNQSYSPTPSPETRRHSFNRPAEPEKKRKPRKKDLPALPITKSELVQARAPGHNQTDEDIQYLAQLKREKHNQEHRLIQEQKTLEHLRAETTKAKAAWDACRAAEGPQESCVASTQALLSKFAVKKSIIEGGETSFILQDLLNHGVVTEWMRTGKWVALAVGNPFTELSHRTKEEIRELIQKLDKEGYAIVYDADSLEANVIYETLGDRALGISGNPNLRTFSPSNIRVIENPFLRMETFATATKIVITPKSVLGLGILMEHFSTKVVVLNTEGSWKKGLAAWRQSFDRGQGEGFDPFRPKNLGITYSDFDEPKAHKTGDEIASVIIAANKYITFQKRTTGSFATSILDIIEASHVAPFQRKAEDYFNLSNQLRNHAIRNQFPNNGAAFLGSKDPVNSYEKAVADVVETVVAMGFSITTGGSTGLMTTANEVASNYEGYSIGIPMGSIGESNVSGIHHLKVSTDSYEQRIPLILQDKEMVLVGPGGAGTMKEVATVFAKFAVGNAINQPELVFIGSDYYQGLQHFLNTNLPQPVLDRMAIVNSGKELLEVMNLHHNQSSLPEQSPDGSVETIGL